MKIKMLANELVDGDIEYVSLVKHGANRSPFKIIKMDEMEEDTAMTKLGDFISGAFGSQNPEVAAFIVKSDSVQLVAPQIAEAGFDISNSQEVRGENGEFTIYKQESYEEDNPASMIAVNEDMAVALDRVVKELTPVDGNDFSDGVSAATFFPGVQLAIESLGDTIWKSLSGVAEPNEAAAGVDKSLAAFRKHVNALVRNLPNSVFKLEFDSLPKGIEGSTVEADTVSKSDGEETMSDERLKEAVAGDLGGLDDLLRKADEAATEDSVASAAEDTAEVSDAGEVEKKAVHMEVHDHMKVGKKKVKKGEDIVELEYNFTVDEDGEEIFMGFIEKDDAEATQEEEAPKVDPVIKGLEVVAAGLNQLVEQNKHVVDLLAKTDKSIQQFGEKATKAIEKSEQTVLVDHGYSLDESFGTLGGHSSVPVVKNEQSEDDVFAGLCPELDALESSLGSNR